MNTQEITLALTPFVSLFGTFLARKIIPNIPGPVLPVVAGVLGVVPDMVQSIANDTTASPLKGFLAGLAAVAIHQVGVQLQKPKTP
jgi:hypothetical protein